MSFNFMDDPRWDALDPGTQNSMIDQSFLDTIASDPRWGELDADTQAEMSDQYRQEAIDYSTRRAIPAAPAEEDPWSFTAQPQTIAEPEETGPQGMLGAAIGGGKQAANSIRAAWNVFTGDEAEARDVVLDAPIEKTAEQDAFMQSLSENKAMFGDESIWTGVKNVAKAAWDNPMGAMHEVAAQLPNSAVIIGSMAAGAKAGAIAGSVVPGAGTAIGAIGGGIVGLMFGNVAIETGGIAQEKIREGEYDRGDILKKGAIKGGIISGVDVATMGTTRLLFRPAFKAASAASQRAATKVLKANNINPADNIAVVNALQKSPKLLREVNEAGAKAAAAAMPRGLKSAGLHGTAFGLDMAGEGVGEYAGSVAAGMDASITDAVMEAMMSMPQSAGEVAVGKSIAKARDIIKPTPGDIADAATVDEAIDTFSEVVAPTAPEGGPVLRTDLGAAETALETAGQLDTLTQPSPYFEPEQGTVEMPLDQIQPRGPVNPDKMSRGRQKMAAAAAGKGMKRAPIKVYQRADGQHIVVDGNTTFHGLKEMGETSAPVKVVKTLKQQAASIDEIYEQAEASRPAVKEITEEFAEKTKGKPHFRPGNALKGRERAEQKVAQYGTHEKLKDIIASTISYKNEEELRAALAKYQKEYGPLELKDNFKKPMRSGYRDVSMTIRLPNGHLSEIQFTTDNMLEAKNGPGHVMYEIARELSDSDNPTALELADRIESVSKDFYDQAHASSAASSIALSSEMSEALSSISKVIDDLGSSIRLDPSSLKSFRALSSQAKGKPSISKKRKPLETDIDKPPISGAETSPTKNVTQGKKSVKSEDTIKIKYLDSTTGNVVEVSMSVDDATEEVRVLDDQTNILDRMLKCME